MTGTPLPSFGPPLPPSLGGPKAAPKGKLPANPVAAQVTGKPARPIKAPKIIPGSKGAGLPPNPIAHHFTAKPPRPKPQIPRLDLGHLGGRPVAVQPGSVPRPHVQGGSVLDWLGQQGNQALALGKGIVHSTAGTIRDVEQPLVQAAAGDWRGGTSFKSWEKQWGEFLTHPERYFADSKRGKFGKQAQEDVAQSTALTKGQYDFVKSAAEHPGRSIPADILALGAALGVAHGGLKLARAGLGTDVGARLLYDQNGEIRPFHGFEETRTAKNLAAKLNPRNQSGGHPINDTVLTANGTHAYGPITPEHWVDRVVKMLPTLEERDASARWYEKFEPLFRKHFPPEVADKLMRAFAVSQANASPVGGLASSVLAHSRMAADEEVGSIGSVVADNIVKALRGEHIDSHVAAKLSDFIDALRGERTRTWMGHDVRGGEPAPIDIWGLRDLGHVDDKLLNVPVNLKGKLGSSDMAEVMQREHGFDLNKAERTPPSASGARYERASEKYHEITDHLNEIGFDGRSDWTPAQTQALGWHAIQRFYGRNPESLEEALLKGPVRAEAMAARQAFAKAVEDVQTPGRGFTVGPDLKVIEHTAHPVDETSTVFIKPGDASTR
jgi:hypothetical protein